MNVFPSVGKNCCRLFGFRPGRKHSEHRAAASGHCCQPGAALRKGMHRFSDLRAAGSDRNMKIAPARKMSLEQALEYSNDDELVEITPTDIRLRKKILGELERKRSGRVYNQVQ